jgi:hypothetical protein
VPPFLHFGPKHCDASECNGVAEALEGKYARLEVLTTAESAEGCPGLQANHDTAIPTLHHAGIPILSEEAV